MALAPNAVRVLDHVGVYDRLRPQGFLYETLHITTGQGKRLAGLLNGSEVLYNFPALRIQRAKLRTTLMAEVEAQGIPIHYGKRCIGIEEVGERARVKFADDSIVEADIVVGADGIHSTVREHIDANAEPVCSGSTGISGHVTKDQLPEIAHNTPLPAMIFGRRGFFALMPFDRTGNEIGYFATLHMPDRSREEWDAYGRDKAQMSAMLKETYCQGDWPEIVQAACNLTPAETLIHWP